MECCPNPISSESQLLDHWSKTKIKIKIHQVPSYLPSLKLLNLSRERSLTEYISSLRNSSNCKLVKSLFSFLLWILRIENVTMRISFLTVRKLYNLIVNCDVIAQLIVLLKIRGAVFSPHIANKKKTRNCKDGLGMFWNCFRDAGRMFQWCIRDISRML